ncbi:MAG: PilZ domain-containing protein [Deltaproteobacteria bacterium]|nr:PilZ domain-containing protein [Deltaproteobacteria bacterium]
MEINSKNINYKELRRHPRIEAVNNVGYALFDDTGKRITTGKGQTLNLSQSGTLLKTRDPIKGVFVVLVTIDLEGKQVKVRGRVRHTQRDESSGFYLTGVEFIGPRDEQLQAIVSFVKAYQHKKNKTKTSYSS